MDRHLLVKPPLDDGQQKEGENLIFLPARAREARLGFRRFFGIVWAIQDRISLLLFVHWLHATATVHILFGADLFFFFGGFGSERYVLCCGPYGPVIWGGLMAKYVSRWSSMFILEILANGRAL